MGGKAKSLLLIVVILAAGAGGYYYWMSRNAAPAPSATPEAAAPSGKTAHGGPAVAKPNLGHPLPGEMVEKEQPFLEADYGFSMVVPAGWRVINWTEPTAPEPGKRRPSYRIRLEEPKAGSLLDFVVGPILSSRSRAACTSDHRGMAALGRRLEITL